MRNIKRNKLVALISSGLFAFAPTVFAKDYNLSNFNYNIENFNIHLSNQYSFSQTNNFNIINNYENENSQSNNLLIKIFKKPILIEDEDIKTLSIYANKSLGNLNLSIGLTKCMDYQNNIINFIIESKF